MSKILTFEEYQAKLRRCRQYKDLPEEEFIKTAKELYDKKYSNKREHSFVENSIGIWLDKKEAKEADKLYNSYLENRNYTDPSDIGLLKTLVFYEIQQKRNQLAINEAINKDKEDFVPTNKLKAVNEINEQILSLKKVLGLSEEKKGKDPLEYINQLKRKFKVWRENNQGTRHLICPHCSKMIMLKIRTEAWEALKHPFFRDRVLCNDHLWSLYKEGKITKLDVAKVLLGKDVEVTFYVDWLEEKIFNVQTSQDPLLESGDNIPVLRESGD